MVAISGRNTVRRTGERQKIDLSKIKIVIKRTSVRILVGNMEIKAP